MASKILTPRPKEDITHDLHFPSDHAGLCKLYDKSMNHVKNGLEHNVYENGSLPERREFMANVLASRIAGAKTGRPGYDIVEQDGHIGVQAPYSSGALSSEETRRRSQQGLAGVTDATRQARVKASMDRFPFQQELESESEKDDMLPRV